MKTFLVTYSDPRPERGGIKTTTFREDSLHDLHKFCMKYNYAIIRAVEITSEEANEIWDIEKVENKKV